MGSSEAIGTMIGAVEAILLAAETCKSARGVLPGRGVVELLTTMRVRHVARGVKCRNDTIVVTQVL